MSKCTICDQNKSLFLLNNKTVCMRCDVLLFDIEIECDEEPMVERRTGILPDPRMQTKNLTQGKK